MCGPAALKQLASGGSEMFAAIDRASPMRALIWIVALFAVAVALTLAARYSSGYVLLVLPSHRVELSVNLAAVLLAVAFIALYGLVRALRLTLALPFKAVEFQRDQRRARARRAFQEAARAFFEGRFGRAERAARQALEQEEAVALSLVLAARSAHQLGLHQTRDEYLRDMEIRAPQEGYMRLMTQAELLLDEQRYLDALQALSQLPDKHTAALRLELKAQQLARNWDRVLQLIPQLEQRRVLEPTLLDQIKRHAQTETLKRQGLDTRSLRAAWDRLSPEDRKDTRIAAAAARCFITLGEGREAHQLIEDSLDANWDASLLPLYVESLPRDARRHLERAEGWVQQHRSEPALLLALGQLCMHQELWGKARSYLEASLAVEPSHSAYVQFGNLLERMGEPDEASRMYRDGLELALAQLKRSTGGRRRPAL
jgi:HemY protein